MSELTLSKLTLNEAATKMSSDKCPPEIYPNDIIPVHWRDAPKRYEELKCEQGFIALYGAGGELLEFVKYNEKQDGPYEKFYKEKQEQAIRARYSHVDDDLTKGARIKTYMGNATNEQSDIIDIVEKFLSKSPQKLPKLEGICALTLGLDKCALVGTFIFDYSKKEMLKHYPARYPCNSPNYVVIGNDKWTINLSTNLPPKSANGKAATPEDAESFPFCCDLCDILYRKRLTCDNVFNAFKKRKGSSEYTFRVVKKIQFGDLLWIKHFKLKDDKITAIDRIETEYKVNSFKIYTCDKHNTYYSVDLHTDKDVHNYHHAKGQNETEFGPMLVKKMQERQAKIVLKH